MRAILIGLLTACCVETLLLAIFDVEGILFDGEYLPILAEVRNMEKEIWEITRQGLRGTINWEDGLRKRVEILRGINYSTCKEIADNLPIMTGAYELCRTLKDAGWRLMAVSGGFTIMTDRLKRDLKLDHVISNELIFEDNQLADVKINVGSDKAFAASSTIQGWGEKKEDIVTIVDGANDMTLFDISGLGIAFRAQDIVRDRADVIIEDKDLRNALDLINKHYGLALRVRA